METTGDYTPAEQELTRILLTELLAHQFCSPVQWIKTQESILRGFGTERLIEIGPGETLVNMARKSLKEGYEFRDIALGLRRELLSYEKDFDKIHYGRSSQGSPVPDASVDAHEISTVSVAPSSPPGQASASMPASISGVSSTRVSLPDKPVSPLDVLTTLVAVTLKKQLSDISQNQTIKAICGGRSTLQNEIIGDFTEELGSLPEHAEDIALSELASTLSDSGQGMNLGARTNALMNKMATSRMPAGSGITVLRQYLNSCWGFKQGLQDRALLLAITSPPTARLASEKDVHLFLDDIAHQVLRGIGLDPSSLSSGSSGQQEEPAGSEVISSTALKAIQSEWKKKDKAMLDVYAKQLGHDILGASSEKARAMIVIDGLQAKNDAWSAEHGEVYERGIIPAFDVRKARKYDSYWNWAVQQVVALVSTALVGQLEKFTSQAKQSLDTIPTRATTHLLQVISFLLRTLKDVSEPELARRQAAQDWLTALEIACRESLSKDSPSFRYAVVSTVPILDIDHRGQVSIKEVSRMVRPSNPKLTPMTSNSCDSDDSRSVVDTESYYTSFSVGTPPISVFSRPTAATVDTEASSANSDIGAAQGFETPTVASSSSPRMSSIMWTPEVKTKGRGGWHTNHEITNGYLRWFQACSVGGVSFSGKAILVTGAGKYSIGSHIVSMSLAAGAKVLVTTSSYSKDTCDYYKDMYHEHGARGSQLVLVPFNGGSVQDVQKLVKYVYDDEAKGGLGWDLDHIVPFAAVGEGGRAIDNIDDKSELAHRVMLTNVVRLLGAIKAVKVQKRITTHPTHVLLPLSPNHGVFGQDGLYAESKMALEALLNKWWSEDWKEYLTVCGVIIGWTRGTGLMSNNDVLATGVEADLGIRTFSAAEMAWHVIGLMDSGTASLCDLEPLMADLSGGLSALIILKPVLQQIQDRIDSKSDINRSIYNEQLREGNEPSGATVPRMRMQKKASIGVERASFPEYREIQPLASKLEGMVDLERVVVVVGFGEVGPYGSSRTRWEAECSGTFSLSGCVELARIMGLVKYHNGSLNGKDYCGWMETKTKAPITDMEIKAKYEDHMVQHTGIRLVERQNHDLVSPDQQPKLHEVVITEDMEPFEVSLGTAEELRREHGSNSVVTETEGGQFSVTLKAGATVWIPKASKSQSIVGAQMPTGWDASTYGIPEDIIRQVDPVTLYALVATVEAFLSAGLTDPFELYKHIQVSELGNALGASIGGVKSLESMFKRRFLDAQIQNDILAETFVNTTAAWVNMLLLGSCGPIRTPVGACATSLESMDTGYDLILNGRAKAVLVGGTDGLERDTAHEFARMKATINAVDDAAAGRTPKEASRPTTSTRAGFVEGEGCGVQLLTTARLALDMGLPIRGVIAITHTASDGIGRSVPSPGKGLLTIAAENRNSKFASPLLDMQHRRRQLLLSLRQIDGKRDTELRWLEDRLKAASFHQQLEATTFHQQPQRRRASNPCPLPNLEEYEGKCRSEILADDRRARQEARNTHGNQFWKHDSSISPLRGALAVWGLTIDDLSVASLHGTSTRQNDTNETAVLQSQLSFLGRSAGNVMPCCVQKGLLGHGKGAAGAFAVNSCLQMLATDLIPGNHNADNIDAALQDRDLLFFPSKTYKSPGGVKAFSVTSFGFGQKGAQVIGVNARYLFATLSQGDYERYRRKVAQRETDSDRALQRGTYGGKLVTMKDKNVYGDDKLEETLLHRS